MAALRDVVVDCQHPAPLARWWAATLDGYRVAPYDDAELDRLRAAGVDDPEDDPSVLVEPVSGTGMRLWFTRVPEPRTGKNRLHLDLTVPDLASGVDALVARGASVLARHDGWTVLADPEGDEFCVFPA
ncbi:VOC family protein [Cellulomonas sp. Marseille-Q8402]